MILQTHNGRSSHMTCVSKQTVCMQVREYKIMFAVHAECRLIASCAADLLKVGLQPWFRWLLHSPNPKIEALNSGLDHLQHLLLYITCEEQRTPAHNVALQSAYSGLTSSKQQIMQTVAAVQIARCLDHSCARGCVSPGELHCYFMHNCITLLTHNGRTATDAVYNGLHVR